VVKGDGSIVDRQQQNPEKLNGPRDRCDYEDAGARTPSWPGLDPETGYVDADCTAPEPKTLADRAGHAFILLGKMDHVSTFAISASDAVSETD
jgi:hypothetical protein